MIKKITLSSVLFMFVLSVFAKDFKKEALTYLKQNKKEFNLSDQDINDLVLASDNYDDYSQINRVWFQQTAYGVPLKNAFVSVHFKDGKVVNSNNSGVYDLKRQLQNTTPSIAPEDAVVRAALSVNVSAIGEIKQQVKKDKVGKEQKLYIFEPINGLTNTEVHAQLELVRDYQDKIQLAWVVRFHSLDESNFWKIEINAQNGNVINKVDEILHCDFGTSKFLESQETHQYESNASVTNSSNMPQGSGNKVAAPTAGSYRVYPYTVESPVYGTRQLLSNPDDAVASPFGWHDTNGAAGAEYTITRGNNVYAYADKDANNSADANSSPDGTASLNFDFPLDFNTQLDTLINSKAIVTQLFYMNNIMHDIFYKYGFTDANRNFQFRNYVSGNTATDNDFVYAEAHDGAGTNNANFVTSLDGANSNFDRTRMQMYMWDGTPPSTLTYNAPGNIAGDIDHRSQNGWGPCSYNVTAAVANATSATAPASYVCGPVNNASSIAGKIAIIDRGTCNFSEKVYYAQQAGAVGVIIVNRQSAGDSLIGMSGGTNASLVTIPALFVTYADGQKLRDNIGTANVTMFRQSTTNCLDLDGSLDNAIMAHEYGHGISTRLTGPGTTTACLINYEQAGEGWSDFFALALTKKTTDTKNTPRGVGNYVIGETALGLGIRNYPYSYDMQINPLTYAAIDTIPLDLDINGVEIPNKAEEHDLGEIWTAVLWDMYWLLVEKYGYSTDIYNGTLGNNRAIKLVIEGLKLQPCSPGFIDGRDAILKADSILYGYADKCEIWTAFARRGMGYSALQGSSNNCYDQTPAFNLPPACNTSPTATASFSVSDTVVCVGGSLLFTNTSTATSGSPDSVRWTILGGTPSTSTSMTTVSPVFNTVGTYVISLVAYKSGTGSSAFTRSIRVKANPTVTVSSPTICSGQTAQPVASGATSYTWTGGLSSVSNPTTPVLTTTTSYTVTGTTQGCTGTAISTVTVTALPTVNAITGTTSVCSGSTTQLSSTTTGGTWSSSNTSVATINSSTGLVSGVSGGSSTITYSKTVSGCTNSVTTIVTVNALPNVTVTSPTICSGNTASLQASGATSYTWTGGLSPVSNPTTPVLTTTTSYTVTGTTGSCSNTAVSTVTVTNTGPPVTITPNPVSICSGESITLTGHGADNYTWTSLQTGTTTGTTLTFVPNDSMVVNLSGTLTGCSTAGTTSVNIIVKPNPVVTVSSPTICSGQTGQPVASGGTSYTWTGGLSPVSNPTTPVLNTTQSYTVIGTTNGCSDTAVSTVTVNLTPTTSITVTPNDSVCIGDSVTLTVSGNALSYSWLPSGSGTSQTITVGGTVTYTVTGTTNTCSSSATQTITATSVPSTPTITQSHDTLNSSTIVVGGTYKWYLGSTLVATTLTPYYKFSTNGSYTVTVTSSGCTSAVSAAFSASSTGIRNSSNSIKMFEVYPNPTEGRFVLNLSLHKTSSVSISLFTADGREVYIKGYGNTKMVFEEMNIEELSKGVYILKLRVDDDIYYHKLIKD